MGGKKKADAASRPDTSLDNSRKATNRDNESLPTSRISHEYTDPAVSKFPMVKEESFIVADSMISCLMKEVGVSIHENYRNSIKKPYSVKFTQAYTDKVTKFFQINPDQRDDDKYLTNKPCSSDEPEASPIDNAQS
jgi:hypothetical protein